ncbi:calmodulin-binding receptor-like cytoplasmic kinase 3 [Tasmannia lanceolata]|uniref:calmodulin-binding receptor-like cytoplasmic kinase 3 n=1 Tax=Tasmannia lanceolata TaxID=3420 RepID=UPI0040631B14
MRMAVFVLGLLMLLLSELPGFVVGSKDCRTEWLSSTLSSGGGRLFYVNKNSVDNIFFCKALEFYFLNLRFCDSELEDWGRFGRKYCGLELPVSKEESQQRAGRKLLPQLTINDPITQNRGRKSQPSEEKHHPSFSTVPKNMVIAIPGMFLLCCALICPCCHARRKETAHAALPKEPNSMDSVSSFGVSSTSERIPGGSPLRVPASPLRVPASPFRVPPSPSRFSSSPQLSRVASIHLNMSQINKATRNFSPALMLGEGGFGTVYRAQLQDGQVVAIKRAKKEHFDALRTEFSSEVELLAKIEHRNLVKLLGYFDKGNERIIITEYVPNGTLREYLDGQHGKCLDFNQRLEIAIDVAHGLTYLHLYAEKPIIHRDVKSSNILLTESMRAKVADFGFARLAPMDADQTHISTMVKGTAGYLDPEYLKTYQLTPKSDVFSFGIVLIEILSGRRPVEMNRSSDERITLRWAFNKYNEGNTKDILDPSMEEAVDEETLEKMLGLAFQCAAPTRTDRPTMKEVGEQLWGIRIDYLRSVKRERAE